MWAGIDRQAGRIFDDVGIIPLANNRLPCSLEKCWQAGLPSQNVGNFREVGKVCRQGQVGKQGHVAHPAYVTIFM